MTCGNRAGVEGERLAAVARQVHDSEAFVFACELVEDRARVVARPVVDRDHLEIGIVHCVEGREHLAGVLAFVVAGHEDADRRVRLERRRLAGVRLVPSAHQPVEDASGHPVPRHDEWVSERKAGHHRDEEVPHRSLSRGKDTRRNDRGDDASGGLVGHRIVRAPAQRGTALTLEMPRDGHEVAVGRRTIALQP